MATQQAKVEFELVLDDDELKRAKQEVAQEGAEAVSGGPGPRGGGRARAGGGAGGGGGGGVLGRFPGGVAGAVGAASGVAVLAAVFKDAIGDLKTTLGGKFDRFTRGISRDLGTRQSSAAEQAFGSATSQTTSHLGVAGAYASDQQISALLEHNTRLERLKQQGRLRVEAIADARGPGNAVPSIRRSR